MIHCRSVRVKRFQLRDRQYAERAGSLLRGCLKDRQKGFGEKVWKRQGRESVYLLRFYW